MILLFILVIHCMCCWIAVFAIMPHLSDFQRDLIVLLTCNVGFTLMSGSFTCPGNAPDFIEPHHWPFKGPDLTVVGFCIWSLFLKEVQLQRIETDDIPSLNIA